jgi:hypothetical protein
MKESKMAMKSVKVECDQCKTVHTVELSTAEVDRNERNMGAEVQFDTTGDVECPCGQHIEYVQSEWEYPEGVPNHSEPASVEGGTLR